MYGISFVLIKIHIDPQWCKKWYDEFTMLIKNTEKAYITELHGSDMKDFSESNLYVTHCNGT